MIVEPGRLIDDDKCSANSLELKQSPRHCVDPKRRYPVQRKSWLTPVSRYGSTGVIAGV